MGFGKAFLLSLTAFVGLNFIFTIINYAIGDGFDVLFSTIENYPLMILYYLFGSIISTPSMILILTIAEPILISFELSSFLLGIGFLTALLIAAILAGRFGESKGQCIGGWVLTSVISVTLVIIGASISATLESTISDLYDWSSFDILLIYSIISCLVNIIFYGFFALLISKIEYY
ncbi:MAG: hypothetical protein ACFFCE_02255 [Promethearchaeota archaeon]